MDRFVVSSTSFSANQPIPRKYTAEGENVSPHISWTSVPKETKQFVLFCEDPDTGRPDPWIHWLLYHIPPEVRSLPEGAAKGDRLKGVPQAVQGKNSWNTIGYRGPQPPPGKPHRYIYRVYALSEAVQIPPEADKAQVMEKIGSVTLGMGELIATYRR